MVISSQCWGLWVRARISEARTSRMWKTLWMFSMESRVCWSSARSRWLSSATAISSNTMSSSTLTRAANWRVRSGLDREAMARLHISKLALSSSWFEERCSPRMISSPCSTFRMLRNE